MRRGGDVGRWTKVRRWLIRLVAAGDTVVMNARLHYRDGVLVGRDESAILENIEAIGFKRLRSISGEVR